MPPTPKRWTSSILNLPTAATSALPKPLPAMTKKRELRKQILAEQLVIDGKKNEYMLYGAQNVFGYAGPTPVSDGKHVCAFFATGVSACYDLDGNRKWIVRAKGGGAEHGNFASPMLCDNQFIVWGGFETRSYDVETGKWLWSNGGQGGNTYGSLFRIEVGKEQVAAFQSGFFTRVARRKIDLGQTHIRRDDCDSHRRRKHDLCVWSGSREGT